MGKEEFFSKLNIKDYNNILDKKWERHLDAIIQNYVADTLYSNVRERCVIPIAEKTGNAPPAGRAGGA